MRSKFVIGWGKETAINGLNYGVNCGGLDFN